MNIQRICEVKCNSGNFEEAVMKLQHIVTVRSLYESEQKN